jgi:hypothetical protein
MPILRITSPPTRNYCTPLPPFQWGANPERRVKGGEKV